MCAGDLETNLQWLAEQPEPEEPTSKKMHRFLQMDYNRAQLLAGLRLLQQCP